MENKVIYVAVNSDDTAIISTVPLVRFYDEQQADKDKILFSWNDMHRPPHWIPQDPGAKKTGIVGYVGEYVIVSKKFIETYFKLPQITWENEFYKIVM